MAAPQKVLSPFGNGPTRRNLFGPVDREQLQVEYQTALRKDLEDASRRWGFDFVSDKPLESSDYQWEGIPDATVPLLYRSCTSGQVRTGAQTLAEATMTTKCGRLESPQSEKENIPLTLERCILDLERLQKTPEKKEEAGAKRKQTNITGRCFNSQMLDVQK